MKRIIVAFLFVFLFQSCSNAPQKNYVREAMVNIKDPQFSELINGLLNAFANHSKSDFSDFVLTTSEIKSMVDNGIDEGRYSKSKRNQIIDDLIEQKDKSLKYFSYEIESSLYKSIDWTKAEINNIRWRDYYRYEKGHVGLKYYDLDIVLKYPPNKYCVVEFGDIYAVSNEKLAVSQFYRIRKTR
jgi:hypothetical protein